MDLETGTQSNPRSATTTFSSTVFSTDLRKPQFISWKSVFAGLFASILCFATLMALGLAIGAPALANFSSVPEFGVGSAVWIAVAAVVALFAGSYLAARVSSYISPRVGAVQGLVISSVFLVGFLYLSGGLVSSVVNQATSALGFVGRQVSDLAQQPQVQSLIDEAVSGLNLRDEPDVVARNLSVYLLQGRNETARTYLARQAGISPAEAEQRLAALQQNFRQTVDRASDQFADAMSILGWSLFGMLILGTIGGALGGALGSQRNVLHPLNENELELNNRQPLPTI